MQNKIQEIKNYRHGSLSSFYYTNTTSTVTNCSSLSEDNAALFLLQMWPSIENSLSQGTLVACMNKYLLQLWIILGIGSVATLALHQLRLTN